MARDAEGALDAIRELSPELAGKVHRASEQLTLMHESAVGVKDHAWVFAGLLKGGAAGYECSRCQARMRRKGRGKPAYSDRFGQPLAARPSCGK